MGVDRPDPDRSEADWQARPTGRPPVRPYDLPFLVLGVVLAAYAGPFTWFVASLGAPGLPLWSALVAAVGLWLAVLRPLHRLRRFRRAAWRLRGAVLETLDLPSGRVVRRVRLDDPGIAGFHVRPHRDGTASVFPMTPDRFPGPEPLVESIADPAAAVAAFDRARQAEAGAAHTASSSSST